MDVILFQSNGIAEISFWSKFWEQLIPSSCIVFITLITSWKFYKHKQKEGIIRQESENFFMISNFTSVNLTNFETIKRHAEEALEEIDVFVTNIDKLKYYLDCLEGKEELKNVIQPSNPQQYIHEEIQKINNQFSLKLIYSVIFNNLIEKDFQKESTIFTMNGNAYFQKILLDFQQDCVHANKNILEINTSIKTQIPKEYHRKVPLIASDRPYEENIANLNKNKQEVLYFKTFFKTLLHISETGIYKAVALSKHLNAFNSSFAKKYAHILKSLNINFSEYQLIVEISEIDKLKTIDDEYKKARQIFWEMPDYNHLKRDWRDKLESLLYPPYLIKQAKIKFTNKGKKLCTEKL